MSVQVGQFYRNNRTGNRVEIVRHGAEVFHHDNGNDVSWIPLNSIEHQYSPIGTVDDAHAEALAGELGELDDAITAQAVTIALQNLEIAALRRRLEAAESYLWLARGMLSERDGDK